MYARSQLVIWTIIIFCVKTWYYWLKLRDNAATAKKRS